MIEELKELLNVIGSVPDMALHAFFAFGVYKIFVYASTTAGIYGVIRLGIITNKEIKLKNAHLKELEINKPKEIIMTSDLFDMYSGDFQRLCSALNLLKSERSRHISEAKLQKVITIINEVAQNDK